jgi:hypothetical protein
LKRPAYKVSIGEAFGDAPYEAEAVAARGYYFYHHESSVFASVARFYQLRLNSAVATLAFPQQRKIYLHDCKKWVVWVYITHIAAKTLQPAKGELGKENEMAKITTTYAAARKMLKSLPCGATVQPVGRKAIVALVLQNDANGVAAKQALEAARAEAFAKQ